MNQVWPHRPLARREASAAEIAELHAELECARAERDSLAAEAEDANLELRTLLDNEIALLGETLDARKALLRVQGTVSWRLLGVLRRQKLALRRVAMGVRGSSRPRVRSLKLPAFVVDEPLGVNVAGYLNTVSGMGEAARLSVRSLEAAGIPVTLNNVASRLRMDDDTYAGFTDANPYPFNLIHLNADNMEWFARTRSREYFRNRYTIGYWFWELAEFRSDWMSAFSMVDEVWTPTEFGRQAIAARSPVPVLCMPLPVGPPARSTLPRAHFGLPEDAVVFLFTFDVSSQIERKNPFGLVAAFRSAFEGRHDVVLLLKFSNAEYDPSGVRSLYRAVDGLNAVLLEGYMDRDELTALVASADCYVSLHRSEGFGLGIAEAMALGKPVIATWYSGPVDFMTAENSYPVNYRIIPIARDYGPYLEGFSWADPDLAQASLLMRRVVENRAEAEVRGEQAAIDIAKRYAPAWTGARVRRRLEEIQSGHVHDSVL